MRWVAQAVVVAAVVTGIAAPAAASGGPVREEARSLHNRDAVKTATVECPGGQAFAVGAQIVGGGGGVVLTAMVPHQDLSGATVEAVARTGYPGEWSVIAYVVCDASPSSIARFDGGAAGTATAGVSCPDGAFVIGVGFRMSGSVDRSQLVSLLPSADLRQVGVRTGGPGVPDGLMAYAICKVPFGDVRDRAEASVAPDDPSWPIAVATVDWRAFGVGGAVSGGGFLTALVPDPDQRRGWARADHPPTSGLRAGLAADADEGEDGSVAVYVVDRGTPY
jgi:hypothetical protein